MTLSFLLSCAAYVADTFEWLLHKVLPEEDNMRHIKDQTKKGPLHERFTHISSMHFESPEDVRKIDFYWKQNIFVGKNRNVYVA